MTLLPELAERDATGEKGEIYAEMKRLGGVPMVALIFRHLATLPGGLEWAWAAIEPAWRTGRLQEAAWRIARETPLASIAAIPRPVLRAIGVDDASEHEIHDVLEAYNRANPENMLSVLCLLRLLGGAATSATLEPRFWTPPPTPQPLVAMADVRTMPCEVSDVLDLVAAPMEPGEPRVVQSLYRHFGHRPGFLALIVTLLRQRFDDGSIDRSVHAIRDAMSVEADKLAARLTAPPAPHSGIELVCRRFGGAVIPQMIVVGRMLEKALPA